LHFSPKEPEAIYFLAISRGEHLDSPPIEYIVTLFDDYSYSFERHLSQELQYQTPGLLMTILNQQVCFPVSTIIDLGCGTGLMGELLTGKSATMIGVDLSPKMIALARKKTCYSNCEQMDIVAYLSHRRDVSLIVAADVFNYFGSLGVVLEKAFLSLSDGGSLAFSTEDSKSKDVFLRHNGRYQHSPEHVLRIANEVGFLLQCQQQAKLRKEKGEWVNGMLFLFQKR